MTDSSHTTGRATRLPSFGRTARVVAAGVVAVAAGVGSYVAWSLQPTSLPAAGDGTASGGTVSVGAALFQSKGCVSCHTGPDGGSPGPGPDLRGLPAIAGERVDGLPPEEYVEQSIRDPDAFIVSGSPGIMMPTLDVSDEELDVLVDYLLAR